MKIKNQLIKLGTLTIALVPLVTVVSCSAEANGATLKVVTPTKTVQKTTNEYRISDGEATLKAIFNYHLLEVTPHHGISVKKAEFGNKYHNFAYFLHNFFDVEKMTSQKIKNLTLEKFAKMFTKNEQPTKYKTIASVQKIVENNIAWFTELIKKTKSSQDFSQESKTKIARIEKKAGSKFKSTPSFLSKLQAAPQTEYLKIFLKSLAQAILDAHKQHPFKVKVVKV